MDSELRDAVRTRWVEPRRKIAREIVRRGMESGELRGDLDADVVLDVLYGPFYHCLLVPYEGAITSDAYVDALIAAVFTGLERNEPNARGTSRQPQGAK
jgi:hypothetical protein